MIWVNPLCAAVMWSMKNPLLKLPFFPGSFLQDSWCLGIGTASRWCWFSNRHCQFQCYSSSTWPMESLVASSYNLELPFQGSDFDVWLYDLFETGHQWLFMLMVILHLVNIYIKNHFFVNIYIYILQFPYKMLLGRSWGGDHIYMYTHVQSVGLLKNSNLLWGFPGVFKLMISWRNSRLPLRCNRMMLRSYSWESKGAHNATHPNK